MLSSKCVVLSQLFAKACAFDSSEAHASSMETCLQNLTISHHQALAILLQHLSMLTRKSVPKPLQPTTQSSDNRCNYCYAPWTHCSCPFLTRINFASHVARLAFLLWYVAVASTLSLTDHDKPSDKYLLIPLLI